MKTMRRTLAVAALAALAATAGCEDLGVGVGGEVTGLTVQEAGGPALVTVTGGSVSGGIALPRNSTRALVVTLRGEGGTVVNPTLAETVRVTVTNPGVASWQDAGSGTGTLQAGPAAGSTTLRVDLIRGGSAVYTSPAISVTVT